MKAKKLNLTREELEYIYEILKPLVITEWLYDKLKTEEDRCVQGFLAHELLLSFTNMLECADSLKEE